MAINLGELSATISADSSSFATELGSAKSMGMGFISSLTSGLESISGALINVGSKLTQYITLPLAGIGVASFNLGKNFETEMAKIVGLVGISKDQVDDWGQKILDMAPKLGKAPKELAEGLYFVTSAGIRGAEAMEVLEMAAKASAAGLGETKTIADVVTSAMNAYGAENLNAAQATDILVAAVREGKTDAAELAGSLGFVLPVASEMGVQFHEVSAAMAAMTRTGSSASEAGTQLKAILSGLLKPSEGAEKALKEMGLSSAGLRKQIKEEGLLKALQTLRKTTNKFGDDAMAKVFPNIRGLSGVLDLMGSNAKDNEAVFKALSESGGELDFAFQNVSNTIDFKWNQAIASGKAALIELFNVIKGSLLPVLEVVSSVIQIVTDKFMALSPQMQQIVVIGALIAAAIGPILVILGTLVGLFAALIPIIVGVIAVFMVFGAPLIAVGAAIMVLVGIVGALVAAFIYLWKTNDEFRENVINTWNTIKEAAKVIFNELKTNIKIALDNIKSFWSSHGATIMAFVKTIFNVILAVIRTTMNIIKNVIGLILSVIRGDWSSAWGYVKGLLSTVVGAIKGILSGLWGAVKSIFSGIVSTIKSLIGKLPSIIMFSLAAIPSLFLALGSKIIGALTGIDLYSSGVAIVQSLINGISSMIGAVTSKISELAGTIRKYMPFSPAKEGPLSDIDKIDFYGPIAQSLNRARLRLNADSFKISDDIMNNLLPSNVDMNLSGPESGTKNINFNGSMHFNGIQDIYDFMEQMKTVIRQHTGRIE
jgi:TP901 family phage tail tape measure protein